MSNETLFLIPINYKVKVNCGLYMINYKYNYVPFIWINTGEQIRRLKEQEEIIDLSFLFQEKDNPEEEDTDYEILNLEKENKSEDSDYIFL